MSEFHTPDAEQNIPRFEPWLAVMGGSFVPALLTVFTPDSFNVPLIGATVVLLVVAFVMLVRQSRTRDGS